MKIAKTKRTKRVKMIMKNKLTNLLTGAASLALCAAAAAGSDKTLVSWVTLANTTQQGGSALTIQQGDSFDGIVFGEKQPAKWMSGSNFYSRTQADQQASSVEKADSNTLVQLAVVYTGNQTTMCDATGAADDVAGLLLQNCSRDGLGNTANVTLAVPSDTAATLLHRRSADTGAWAELRAGDV